MAASEHVARATRALERVRDVAGRLPLAPLLGGTLLAVYLTILLGVATKGTGSGLACNARWPVCDGGLLNLFPASLPSFFEWIHRVVAGLTGLLILGTGVAVWRREVGGGIRGAVTLGVVLLPVQVLLGRETVVSFTFPVLMAHFWVAFAIFASFAVAAALAGRHALEPRRLRVAAVAGAGLVPAALLLHPPVVTAVTPTVRTLRYAVVLTTFALVVAAAVGARAHLDRRAFRLAVGLALVQPLLVLAGRHMVALGAAVLWAYLLLSAVLAGGLLVLAGAFHGRSTA